MELTLQSRCMAPINTVVAQELAALIHELEHQLNGRNQYILRWAFYRLIELERRIDVVRSLASNQRAESQSVIAGLQSQVERLTEKLKQKSLRIKKPRRKRVNDYHSLLAYT